MSTPSCRSALALPSIAASNLELKDGGEAALDTLSKVESFARTGYLLHLAAGMREDDSVNALLEQYTGLGRELSRATAGSRRRCSCAITGSARGLALSRYDGSVGAQPRSRGQRPFRSRA